MRYPSNLLSMCMIINSRLDEAIFARFHPHLKPEQPESKVIADIYAEIRAAGPPHFLSLCASYIHFYDSTADCLWNLSCQHVQRN
jgi:hypothetical protein